MDTPTSDFNQTGDDTDSDDGSHYQTDMMQGLPLMTGLTTTCNVSQQMCIKYHQVMVDSADRDLLDPNESELDFICKFQPAGLSYDRRPVYKNQQTLPQNPDQRRDGIYGNVNYYFHPSEPRGEIIGYDMIKTEGDDRGCSILEGFHNVVSIFVDRIFVPILLFQNPFIHVEEDAGTSVEGSDDVWSWLKHTPIVGMELFPYSNTYGGTNNLIRRATVMFRAEKLTGFGTRRYVICENFTQRDTLIFTPPESQIDKIRFRMFHYAGDKLYLIIKPTDILRVRSISPKGKKLKVKTDYFQKTIYRKGTIVSFRNYQPKYLDGSHDYVCFKDFINNHRHIILGHEDDDSDDDNGEDSEGETPDGEVEGDNDSNDRPHGISNTLYISSPLIFNRDTGTWEYDRYYQNIYKLLKKRPKTIGNSICLNMDMQTQIHLEIRTQAPALSLEQVRIV